MADAVRHVLESMVPELDALHERGLFSRKELQEVVKRRTDYEYAIRRPGGKTTVTDFMRYLEYEAKLEALRKIRAKTPKAKETAKNDKIRRKTKGQAEFCIVRRMHFIYSRAINKFSGDLRVWRSYFDFCKKHGGSKTFSRLLAKALQLHPNKPGMWIEAASWELNGHRNDNAARALLQQGLRVCKKSKALWLEYFKFELLMARRMQLRKEVISIDGTKAGDKKLSSYNAAVAGGAVATVVLNKLLEALLGEDGLEASGTAAMASKEKGKKKGAVPPMEVYKDLAAVLGTFDKGAFPKIEALLLGKMKQQVKEIMMEGSSS